MPIYWIILRLPYIVPNPNILKNKKRPAEILLSAELSMKDLMSTNLLVNYLTILVVLAFTRFVKLDASVTPVGVPVVPTVNDAALFKLNVPAV